MLEIYTTNILWVFVLMTYFWILGTRIKNISVVDIGWAFGFVVCGVSAVVFGQGDPLKKGILLLMVLIWSLRLGFYLIKRFRLNYEDPRYTQIKKNMGSKWINSKILLMFLFQGFLVVVLSTPFVIVSTNSISNWSIFEFAGILIWTIGLIGETIADQQMSKFKTIHKGSKKVCDIGLWRYSRHPNYFFEWVIWIGFSLFALPASYGWTSIISVAIMYYLLRYLSGVPPSEAQALKTRGRAYKEYQSKTSIFFPRMPNGRQQ